MTRMLAQGSMEQRWWLTASAGAGAAPAIALFPVSEVLKNNRMVSSVGRLIICTRVRAALSGLDSPTRYQVRD